MTDPHRAAKACAEPGCLEAATYKGRCEAHKVNPWAGSYKPAKDWGRRRQLVLLREPMCAECGAPSTTVDHIIPVSEGGSDSYANLRGLCAPCHKDKTQEEAARGRKRHSP